MELEKIFRSSNMNRRDFLKAGATLATATSLYPLAGCGTDDIGRGVIPEKRKIDPAMFKIPEGRGTISVGPGGSRTLLKNGLVVDGSGKKPFIGDVMLNGGRVEMVTPKDIQFSGKTVDCAGKVVAPGFIDAHSHMDRVLPARGKDELKLPFTEQGITTMVAGNCGFGMGAFPRNTTNEHWELLLKKIGGYVDVNWKTYKEYFQKLRNTPLTHNIATLAGHGTTRTAMRGYDPSPLKKDEMKQMIYLLEQAMDQGALGVSLGLQYEPGIFATLDELGAVAKMVKKNDGIMTSHMKAYSKISGTYPLKPFGRPHNLLGIDDMLKITRDTGVKMQLSHLIFVGAKTWDTCGEALQLIDNAIAQGMDVKFDTYSYHCGYSVINVFYPEWFLARVPEVYDDTWAMLKLRAQMELMVALLGFGYQDIQILNAIHPELKQYDGMFLKDIADKRGMSQFENFIDVTKKSNGRAVVLNHRYSSLENVKDLMKHPAALYQTDALVFEKGAQNPAAYGCFPRFLQFARDFQLISLEECVNKMTGAVADRFQLKQRGLLKKGYYADVTVFDWQNVMDNNTLTETANRPSGIELVYMNGKEVLKDGKASHNIKPGMVIT